MWTVDSQIRTQARNATTVADAASLLAERLRRGDLDGVVPCGECEGKGWAFDGRGVRDTCPRCERSDYASGDEALALLAYVGHPAALAVKALRWKCGKCQIDAGEFATTETFARHSHRCPLRDLATWAGGLTRWGSRVAVRAAVLAGRVARESFWLKPYATMDDWSRAGNALDAAQAWLDDPSEANMRAWFKVWVNVTWFVSPLMFDTRDMGAACADSIYAAAKVAGEAAVREAIRDGITAWILG